MKVQLINCSHESPEEHVMQCARRCYSTKDFNEITNNGTNVEKFIKNLKGRKHLTPFEMVEFTFSIDGISRACSHQLVRYRTATFLQESQRFTKPDGKHEFVVPESISKNEKAMYMYKEILTDIKDTYNNLVKEGIPLEDARFVLPNAKTTHLVMKIDARNLQHVFNERLNKHAQWEIRDVAQKMYNIVTELMPNSFTKPE